MVVALRRGEVAGAAVAVQPGGELLPRREDGALLQHLPAVRRGGQVGRRLGPSGLLLLQRREGGQVEPAPEALEDTEHVGVVVEWDHAAAANDEDAHAHVGVLQHVDVGDGSDAAGRTRGGGGGRRRPRVRPGGAVLLLRVRPRGGRVPPAAAAAAALLGWLPVVAVLNAAPLIRV